MIIERAAQAYQLHLGIPEPLGNILPLRLAQRDLDTVCVRGAQLDAFKQGFFAVLDDGRDVPVFGEVVGDGAQADLRWFGEGGGWFSGGKGGLACESKRAQPETGGSEETAAIGFCVGYRVWFHGQKRLMAPA